MGSTRTNTLIVGAGPCGLCLAILLAKCGQKFTIIERKNPSADQLSKATGIHRNSLKFLDKIGLVDEIVSRSIELHANNMIVYPNNFKSWFWATRKLSKFADRK